MRTSDNPRTRRAYRIDCFDGAKVEGASWVQCRDIDRFKADAATYETIADIMADQWRSGRGQPWAGADQEQLYKTYQIIVLEDDAKPEGQRALSAQGRDVLLDKARKLHDELEPATASPHGEPVRNEIA